MRFEKTFLRDAKGPSQRDGRKSQSSRGKERKASKVQDPQRNTNGMESSGLYRLIFSEEWEERGSQQKAGRT